MRFEEIRSADRRIGGGPESGGARRGRGVNAAPIEGAGVEMTGGRIYWPLGRIVTFRTTIYDDWNSGQSNLRNTQQRGREGGGEVTDERHLAKLVQLARAPDEKGFSDRRIRLVTNFLMGIIHLYRPSAGTTATSSSSFSWISIFHLDGTTAPLLSPLLVETEFKHGEGVEK